jgi:hypothetical protein
MHGLNDIHFSGEPEGRRPLEKLGRNGRTILKWILKCEGVDWIHVAQDRVQWQNLVNIVTNLRVP